MNSISKIGKVVEYHKGVESAVIERALSDYSLMCGDYVVTRAISAYLSRFGKCVIVPDSCNHSSSHE